MSGAQPSPKARAGSSLLLVRNQSCKRLRAGVSRLEATGRGCVARVPISSGRQALIAGLTEFGSCVLRQVIFAVVVPVRRVLRLARSVCHDSSTRMCGTASSVEMIGVVSSSSHSWYASAVWYNATGSSVSTIANPARPGGSGNCRWFRACLRVRRRPSSRLRPFPESARPEWHTWLRTAWCPPVWWSNCLPGSGQACSGTAGDPLLVTLDVTLGGRLVVGRSDVPERTG